MAIHAEATPNLHQVLGVIRAAGAKAGLALNPSTAVESVSDVLGDIDYLLILSADVGFENASFLPGALWQGPNRLRLAPRKAAGFRDSSGREHRPGADGGAGAAGADILVAGSDIFQKDPRTRLVKMMRLAASSRQSFQSLISMRSWNSVQRTHKITSSQGLHIVSVLGLAVAFLPGCAAVNRMHHPDPGLGLCPRRAARQSSLPESDQ